MANDETPEHEHPDRPGGERPSAPEPAAPEPAAPEPAAHEPAAPEPAAPEPAAPEPAAPPPAGDRPEARSPWAPQRFPAGPGQQPIPPVQQPAPPRPAYPGLASYPVQPYPGVGQPMAQFPPQIPAQPPDGGARRLWLLAAGIALVTALLGGLLGGVVGYQVAKTGRVGSVLDGPLPGIGSSSAPETAVEQVAQQVLPSVVQLRLRSGERSGTGSGMVLSPDGLVLTNNHVIEGAAGGAAQITALFQDGRTAPVQIVGRDPTSDIAVVKVVNVSGLTPIELGNSDAVRVGQQVMAIGSPLALGGTVTTGIVSALNRAVSVAGDSPRDPLPDPLPLIPSPGPRDPTTVPRRTLPAPQDAASTPVFNAIQTDAAVNPGNSGGPLVDIEGRVIGINSAIASVGGGVGDEAGSVGLGFSIPINQAKRVAEELQRTGQATKPVLGVKVEGGSRLMLSDQPGAKLIDVVPNGPAAKAGLKPGDLVVKVNKRVVIYGDELVAAIRALAPGDTVQLTLSDGRTVSSVLDGEPVPATK